MNADLARGSDVIQFPCKCGYAFDVPEDQAGGVMQCPDCGLLADVPTLSDLRNIAPNGTFLFEDPASLPDDITAADLHHVFTNKTKDSHGIEKDLRPLPERYDAIGLQDEIAPRPAPRYDPVTGELIRPLQLKDETPIPVISIGELVDPSELESPPDPDPLPVIPIPAAITEPVPQPKSLGYATGSTGKQLTTAGIALELLMPANIAVMFFVFVLYILGFYTTLGLGTYTERFFAVVWPFLLVNVPMWLIISHIGSVIEDTGPDAIDELPRPFRNLSLGEDILAPLFRTILGSILCFWPTLLAIYRLNPGNPATAPIIFALALGGAFLFPAVLLTAITGTTILNLSPDRVFSVIRLCAGNYFISIALLIPPAIASFYYLAAELLFPQHFNTPFFSRLNSPKIMLPALMATVYLLHYFCWHLGMMYRAQHDNFPWLAQRHVRAPKSQPG